MPARNPPYPVWIVVFLIIALTGCSATTTPTIKIGVVAPFEGRYRELGYDIIPAARTAIQDWASTSHSKQLNIELIAYDDMGEPAIAIEQAKKLAVDPEVAIVIGHWRDETTSAALSIYEEAALPLITFSLHELQSEEEVFNLAPSLSAIEIVQSELKQDNLNTFVISSDNLLKSVEETRGHSSLGARLVGGPSWGLSQFNMLTDDLSSERTFLTWAALPDDQTGELWTEPQIKSFNSEFQEGSLGAQPGLFATSAYEATWIAINYLAQQYDIPTNDLPLSSVQFDNNGRVINPTIYYYKWVDNQLQLQGSW